MFKTIAVSSSNVALPLDKIQTIRLQIESWLLAGKYTGEIDTVIDGSSKTVTRWDWIDEESANAYKAFIIGLMQEYYPEISVNIVSI